MSCMSPYYKRHEVSGRYMPLPCGRCPHCKTKRVSQWVLRLEHEDIESDSSYFVTLTYDTNYVPISKNGFPTLKKRDLQLYWKRLRKLNGGKRIKYYAVGEYGSKRNRPHYHAIVFNISNTSYFDDAWNLGAVHVGNVSGASIAYTAKYIDKDKRIPMFKGDDRLPEYSTMSKGLGKKYLEKRPQLLDYYKKTVKNGTSFGYTMDGYRVSLPRYYRDIIYSEEERKQLQKAAMIYEYEKMIDRQKLAEQNGKELHENDYETLVYKHNKFYNRQKLSRDEKI